MDSNKLTERLHSAVDSGIEDAGMPFVMGHVGNFLKKRQGKTKPSLMEELISALAESPEICHHFDNTILLVGNSITNLSLPLLVAWLVARCRQVSVEECVGDLENFIGSDSMLGEERLVVGGLSVGPARINLIDDISLEPLPYEPDSTQLALIYDSWAAALIELPELYRPEAALSCNAVHKKCIGTESFVNNAYPSRHFRLLEICTSLTTFKAACPVPIGHWWQAAESVPCSGLNGFRITLQYQDGRIGPHHQARVFTEEDYSAARKATRRFLGLTGDSRARVHTVLDRLNRSRRRLSLVDRAIELGIAMESLFLYEPGKKHTSELTFRLKLRAA